MTRSTSTPRRTSSGRPRRRCRRGRSTARVPRAAAASRRAARRRDRRRARRDSASGSAARSAEVDLDAQGRAAGHRRSASGCAPPMPPSPAVSTRRPARVAAEPLARGAPRTSRTSPAGCPACRCRSTSPAVICPYIISPAARAAGTRPSSPSRATRFEFASSTRGRPRGSRTPPTGLPDCTSSVSSSPSALELADDRVVARPVARGLAHAAVDDEIRRLLRDVGVQVVLEHAQGGLLLPPLAPQSRGAHAATAAPGRQGFATARRRDERRPGRRCRSARGDPIVRREHAAARPRSRRPRHRWGRRSR